MDLFRLEKVTWEESQLLYHALAYAGREALVLLSPSTPYVCIGFHQEAEAEVDFNYCHANSIPVFRREVGGGAVYLDGNQFFFQLVLKKDNPLISARKEVFYERFLQPVIETYRTVGIPAEYKPVNDVLAGSRKISGTGVGEIGDCVVFVGNLILDFNYDMMSRVLMVPDEKFRDKVHKTLQENLTTIRRELGPEKTDAWNESSLNDVLLSEFEKLLGDFQKVEIDQELRSAMDKIASRMISADWLHQRGRRQAGRNVKIQTDVHIVQKIHKAVGGLIRATYETRKNRIYNVSLTGDFFCYPPDAITRLENRLEGVSTMELRQIINRFYEEERIETTGLAESDWMMVLTG